MAAEQKPKADTMIPQMKKLRKSESEVAAFAKAATECAFRHGFVYELSASDGVVRLVGDTILGQLQISLLNSPSESFSVFMQFDPACSRFETGSAFDLSAFSAMFPDSDINRHSLKWSLCSTSASAVLSALAHYLDKLTKELA